MKKFILFSATTLFALSIIVTATLSCNRVPCYEAANNFDVSDLMTSKVSGEEIFPADTLHNPEQIYVLDSLLLVTNSFTDKLIDVYRIEDGKRKGSFLSRGKGPEELTRIKYIDFSGDGKTFAVNDIMLRKVLVYRTCDLSCLDSIRPVRTIPLPEYTESIHIFSDGKILAMPMTPMAQKRFKWFDQDGKPLFETGNFPRYKKTDSLQGRSEIYMGRFVVKGDETSIAMFNKTTDLIEWYNGEGNNTGWLHGPDHFFPIFQIKDDGNRFQVVLQNKEARNGYFDPVVKEDEIWVKYSGDYIGADSTHWSLMRFNWNGKPIARYNFPIQPLAFDVDVKARKIYALTFEPDLSIRIFNY